MVDAQAGIGSSGALLPESGRPRESFAGLTDRVDIQDRWRYWFWGAPAGVDSPGRFHTGASRSFLQTYATKNV